MMKVSVNVFDGRYILAYKLYVISADTPKTTHLELHSYKWALVKGSCQELKFTKEFQAATA